MVLAGLFLPTQLNAGQQVPRPVMTEPGTTVSIDKIRENTCFWRVWDAPRPLPDLPEWIPVKRWESNKMKLSSTNRKNLLCIHKRFSCRQQIVKISCVYIRDSLVYTQEILLCIHKRFSCVYTRESFVYTHDTWLDCD